MKTIFISIPMHGKTSEEINAAINECIDWWEKNHHPADSYAHNATFKPSVPLVPGTRAYRIYCLGAAIQMLGQCDAVIMGKDWTDAKGCCVEHGVAKSYGIDVYYYVEDKNGQTQEPKTNTDRGV